MNRKINGSFEEALIVLLERLVRAKGSSKLATELLYDWDQRRGNDWFSDTLRAEENRDLYDLQRLKDLYE